MDPFHSIGSLLGTAVGDAMGLPYENLSPGRALRLLGPPDHHRLVTGHGMVSDDTEHACMTAAALIRSGGEPERFASELARQLRWWILSLPGGTGLATARAACRLWLGLPPHRSGVRSAGNGPAMRAPILGATIADTHQLRALVQRSSQITHTDPRARDGAWIVALAAHAAARLPCPSAKSFRDLIEEHRVPQDAEFARRLKLALHSVEDGEDTAILAARQGMQRGVSGFIVHTVPVAVHAWLSHPLDLRRAVQACIRCGGDTDTTAAIAGGIVGAAVGPAGVPSDWLTDLWAWPRSARWMQELACAATNAVSSRQPGKVPFHPWPAIPLRNLGFLTVVLGHGFRRLAPPY